MGLPEAYLLESYATSLMLSMAAQKFVSASAGGMLPGAEWGRWQL